MSSLTSYRRPVKPTRRSFKPTAPFGAGLTVEPGFSRLPFDNADRFVEAEMSRLSDVGPTDREWDALAEMAGWLDAYEAGLSFA